MKLSPTIRRVAVLAATTLALGWAGAGQALAAATPTVRPSVTDPSALVATATKAIDLQGMTVLGPLDASKVLNIDLSLQPRDAAGESAALKAMYTPGSTTFHQFITPAEFTASYAPTAASVALVTDYLSSQGFTNISVLSNRMMISASAPVASIDSAFHTVLSNVQTASATYMVNTAPALVPASLASTVEAVLGLNDIPLSLPTLTVKPQAGSPDLEGGLAPEQFQTTYDAKGTPTGATTSIALFTEGSLTQVVKDLRLAETKNHLSQVAVTEIPVGVQSSDTSGMDEFDLDTQSSTAMATTVKHLYLYDVGSLTDAPIDLDFATFFAQDKAVAMSASIGGCDIGPFLDGSMVSTDQAEEEGAMQGQSLFASSGDNGEGCAYVAATGVPSGFPGTNWPASGEFTTAVGGTSLISDSSGNRIEELGWAGSGGGISEVENPGWWTQDTDPGYAAEYAQGGRSVPDVALDADPNVATPALIYVNGAVEGVGGTSLSSPLMLGAWARIQSAHADKLGFAAIDLYQVYDAINPGTVVPGVSSVIPTVVPSADPQPVPGFTDITVGTNGLYACTPGYDEVTGLGAPDIAALSKVIK